MSRSARSRSQVRGAEARRPGRSRVTVNDSIIVTITTAMLLSVINLTDTKSLEEVQDNFWKSQIFGTCRRLVLVIAWNRGVSATSNSLAFVATSKPVSVALPAIACIFCGRQERHSDLHFCGSGLKRSL